MTGGTVATERDADTEATLRAPKGRAGAAVAVWAILLSALHLAVAVVPFLPEFTRNVLHFAGFAVLAAVLYPAARRPWAFRPAAVWADLALGVLAAVSAIWFVVHNERLYGQTEPFGPLDWAAAILLLALATEFTRRVAGWSIPILIWAALTYVAVWGSWITGLFSFPGFRWETVFWRSIYGDDGMFGGIAQISSTTVFLFVIFGAFLVRSGAGDFVIALAKAAAGRIAGGPGFVAVLASALTGTISGSAVANTASTGVVTIPLMKRAGYSPAFAGGVEAAASTGGQLMPPVMGAGAFVMASLTRIPYETIVLVSIVPAILYFASVAFLVRIEAKRLNLPPLPSDGETVLSALRKGGAPFLIPVGLMVWMLVAGFTPNYAAVFAILAVIVASWASAHPMGPRAVAGALADGARGMVMTAIILCSVGLFVNVVTTAGIGNTFSLMISAWSGGNVLLAMTMIAVASIVLGLGLPVTAAYVVLATVSAPALAGMLADREVAALIASGTLPETAKALFLLAPPEILPRLAQPMPLAEARALVASLPLEVAQPLREATIPREALTTLLLAAHLVIFWLSQDSNVTPPVALASFTAAAIAKAPPMATSWASWKLAKGLYIVPLLFVYTPILSGDWGDMLYFGGFALVGVYGIAGALQGGLEAPLGWPLRAVLLLAGGVCVWPTGLAVNLAGVAAIGAILARNLRAAR
jgi:TRAP transporter 4TM/12TM fusion protein